MPTLAVGTANVHYTVTGSGPRLVLVHGTGSGGAQFVWGEIVQHFAVDHTVLLPDLSGTRNTVDDGGEITIEQLAGQVAAVIEATGDGPVDVMGFSLGGSITAALAGLRPDLVARLVTVAGYAHADHRGFQQHLTLWRSFAGDPDTFGKYATNTAFSPSFLGGLDAATIAMINAGMAPDEGTLRHIDLDLRVDIRALLPKVTAPTLVIGNAKDYMVPVELTREIADGIAGSEYLELDSGHVTFAEEPYEALKAVYGFLNEQGPA